ncbi:MAG: 50S ribosomal protein L4 [Candidatus Pelagibacterales bacterium]|nr:MAG: 50S ribosomal protein L4 [Pelagibacterales bacterium]
MKINTLNINGNGKSLELSEKIFSASINKKLMSHILYSLNGNAKLRLAKTKQKNEIKGSTSKIYAQKGTGNARHASRKAPLFVGGGIAHGPKGGGNYKVRKLNKREKKLSVVSILSKRMKDKNLFVFDDFEKKISKTKEFFNILKKFEIKNGLIVVDTKSKENIEKASKNIPNIKIIMPEGLNLYQILKYEKIIFTTSSVKNVERIYINE